MRNEWRISTGFGDFQLVPWQAADWARRSAALQPWTVPLWEIDRSKLIDICKELDLVTGDWCRMDTPFLHETVNRALQEGRILAFRIERARFAGGFATTTDHKEPSAEAKKKAAPEVKSKCEPTITIEHVRRGNPYVSKNASAAGGMPDSVPPSKTYEVTITVTHSLKDCAGDDIELLIINGSAENGTATVAPARIAKTATVTITGQTQTKPGHGGNLKIQAKLDGKTVKAESVGFTVCAHPVNYTDAFSSDIDQPARVGVRVQDGWDSDSGSFADLDEAEDSELVAYDPPTVPPYAAMRPGGAQNSGYQPANRLTQDSHTIGRPSAGPAATWERRQLCIFKCQRCGATDQVHPSSGFKIVHEVFKDGAQWKHKVNKFGAKVTVGAYTAEAGTANVTSPDHALP